MSNAPRQPQVAVHSAGAMVALTGNGGEPRPVEEILTTAGVSAVFEIEAGALDRFECNSCLRFHFTEGVTVIAVFDDIADALELQHRIAARWEKPQ